MQSLTDAHLAAARALGVQAGLRGDPTPELPAASVWALVMPRDVADFERSASRRLHAAFRQGSQARRLELETARPVAA